MEQKGTAMLANYIIKMTLDNGDSFTIGIIVGILIGTGMAMWWEWEQNR